MVTLLKLQSQINMYEKDYVLSVTYTLLT